MRKDTFTAEYQRQALAEIDVEGEAQEELLARDGVHRLRCCPWNASLPLPPEPQVEAWHRTIARADEAGAATALAERFVQLRFPVRAGMSESSDYLKATRRGEIPEHSSESAQFAEPERLGIRLYRSFGGTVPIIVAGSRHDFENLIRCLSLRNEPREISPSQGACLVNGLNDWERIRHHRETWTKENQAAAMTGGWPNEFRRLKSRPELYQDRFVILSEGPYSGVDAKQACRSESAWLTDSFGIRLEHECTHYFALRSFGSLRHDLLEELVADFVGLVCTFGEYPVELAHRFLGLENHPQYRSGARLDVYRGDPPLSDEAFVAMQNLAHVGCVNLGRTAGCFPDLLNTPDGLAMVASAMTSLPSAALAANEFPRLVSELIEVQAQNNERPGR